MPATSLPQTYALDRAATGIADCGFTSLKSTVFEVKLDSEMNIAIEQRMAMYVHITRLQVPYL
jgi:hypothetical protein